MCWGFAPGNGGCEQAHFDIDLQCNSGSTRTLFSSRHFPERSAILLMAVGC